MEKIDSSTHGPKLLEISTNTSDPDIDIYPVGPDSLVKIKDEYDMVMAAIFNFTSDAANVHFRRAVSYRIDREKIQKEIGRGMPVTQLISPMFAGHRTVDTSGYREIAIQEVKKIPKDLLAKTYDLPVFDLVTQDKSVRSIVERPALPGSLCPFRSKKSS